MTKKLLFVSSIVFVVAILAIATVTSNWSIVFLALITLSIILSIVSQKSVIWQQQSLKQNASSIVKITILLAVVIFLNILAIRYDRRWDVTENQIHTLSPLSQAVLTQLELPLEVLVFDRDLDPNFKNLLENYRRQSQKFNFQIIDPERELGLAREYGVDSFGDVYLQYGDKIQKITPDNNLVSAVITETQLTNNIEKIQRDRTINIYLLQGHGEATNELVEGGIAQVVTSLEAKGYRVNEVNLASQGKIPQDANLIVIAGANRQLLVAEVTSLQQYLKTGGNLLLLLSPSIDLGITPLLQEWGIKLDNRLVVDGSGAGEILGFGPGVAVIDSYGDHPITADLNGGTSIFPESRPLQIELKTEIKATPLILTNEQTWAENDLKNAEITFDSTKDISGPLNIATALERDSPQASRMVVFGSSTFATNGWFEQQYNGDLILNSISWLIGEDKEIIAIRPREATNRRINLSTTQAVILDWLTWRITPLLALVATVRVWLRRR